MKRKKWKIKEKKGKEKKESTLTASESIFSSISPTRGWWCHYLSIQIIFRVYSGILRTVSSSTRHIKRINSLDNSRSITLVTSPVTVHRDRRMKWEMTVDFANSEKNRLSRNVLYLSFAEKRTASGNAAQCNLIRANTKIARRSLFASLSLVILFRRLTVKSQNFPYTAKIRIVGSEAFINFSASIFRARVITRI